MGIVDLMPSMPLVTIEVDPGIDDLVALIVMLGAHRLGLIKILAIICSNGNMPLKQSCENTKLIMDYANFPETQIPLFYGVESAIYTDVKKDLFYGIDGLGDIYNKFPSIKPKPRTIRDAAEFGVFLRDKLAFFKRGVTLMSLGSLTFTATVLLQQPHLKVEGIWIMGGNDLSTKKIEWNVLVDPDAAHYVLRSNVSMITMVNFQDCQTVETPMTWRNNTLGKINTPIIKLLNLAERNRRNKTIWYMYDPILAVPFIDRSSVTNFKYEYVKVNLDHSNKATYGLFEKGPWKIRLIKGLHQQKYQEILEHTAKNCK